MLKITILPTRDVRERSRIIRKRLYLVDFFIWKFVIMKVYRNYSLIYAKNIEACKFAKKFKIDAPKHFLEVPFLGLSIQTWEGENVLANFNNLNKEEEVKLIFKIFNFHSDRGHENINYQIADYLQKLLIKQTKSRSYHSNDNTLALVETKNGSVI